VALVPWLLLLRGVGPRAAFGWSWLIGVLFFLGSIWWLVHVTLIGWLLLCADLGLFFACFGLLAFRLSTIHRPPSTVSFLLLPSVWVMLEYVRSHLLSGFGWNLLAYSQTSWLPIIQVADLTGAWGVSWLIVAVNVALEQSLVAVATERQRLRVASGPVAAATAMVLTVVGYGVVRLAQFDDASLPRTPSATQRGGSAMPYGGSSEPRAEVVRVAVVQGNIPQAQKWDEAFAAVILERYERLTRQAAVARPDLIVWPETAVPGYLNLETGDRGQETGEGELTRRVLELSRSVGVPLLVGAPRAHESSPLTWQATNSAVLMEDGTIRQWYDKLHLVPFGEFIPFERAFPWLREALPPIGDFVPGRSHTVFATAIRDEEFGIRESDSAFRTPHSALAFSTLICFEDVFPELARRFVREGARMLIVITNDAWFGPTAAAYQHAQASTFRAVELRVPVARAANTGWSGCLDAGGRWTGRVQDPAGRELFVEGATTCELPLGLGESVYGRFGDWFVLACLLVVVAGIVAPGIFRRRS
jgi:apolipoprotein N-acyltransferase